jgi:integrase
MTAVSSTWEGEMARNRHSLRGERGRFAARPGDELKRGRGGGADGRPQIRSKHKRALTRREIDLFLSILAETCNVSLAAREMKRSTRVFYDLKKRDSGFRAAWMDALREGYDHLEMELVRRARFGTPRDVFYQGKKTGTTRVFNDSAALRLLHLHRKTVQPLRSADSGRRNGAAIFDELAARLAEIRAEKEAKRREAEGGDS